MGRKKKGVINEARRQFFRMYIYNRNYEYYPIEMISFIHMNPSLMLEIPTDFKYVNFSVPKSWLYELELKNPLRIFREAVNQKQFLGISFS